MKKNSLFLLSILVLIIASCNNSAEPAGNAVAKTQADTLFDEVMDGHNVGMAKMGKLTTAEQHATRLLDSIAKLPARAKESAAPLKAKLDNLLIDLKEANAAMDKWMNEFEIDSFAKDAKERIKYLTSEKGKVTQVKESILNSLQKADSVLHSKL
jgi:hypothetical protein